MQINTALNKKKCIKQLQNNYNDSSNTETILIK